MIKNLIKKGVIRVDNHITSQMSRGFYKPS